MWTPKRLHDTKMIKINILNIPKLFYLCTALQSRQMYTAYVTVTHDGFLWAQSKQTLFSGFERSFLNKAFFSAWGTCTADILLY